MLPKIVRIDLCLTRTMLYGSAAFESSFGSLLSHTLLGVSTAPGDDDDDDFVVFVFVWSATGIANGSPGSWSFILWLNRNSYALHFLSGFCFHSLIIFLLFFLHSLFDCSVHLTFAHNSHHYRFLTCTQHAILITFLSHTASFASFALFASQSDRSHTIQKLVMSIQSIWTNCCCVVVCCVSGRKKSLSFSSAITTHTHTHTHVSMSNTLNFEIDSERTDSIGTIILFANNQHFHLLKQQIWKKQFFRVRFLFWYAFYDADTNSSRSVVYSNSLSSLVALHKHFLIFRLASLNRPTRLLFLWVFTPFD